MSGSPNATNLFIASTIAVEKELPSIKNESMLGTVVKQAKDINGEFGGVGSTVYVRRSPRVTPCGETFDSTLKQSVSELDIPVSIDKTLEKGVAFTQSELALLMNNDTDAILRGAEDGRFSLVARNYRQICTQMELKFFKNVLDNVYNVVTDPGAVIATTRPFTAAVTRLNELGVPVETLASVVSQRTNTSLIDGAQAIYAPMINDKSLDKTFAYPIMGVRMRGVSNFLPYYETGTRTNALNTVSVASNVVSKSSSISLTGFAANVTIKKGEKFRIQGIRPINFSTRMELPTLAAFSVKEAVQADGSGNVTLDVVLTNEFRGPEDEFNQNINRLPVAGDYVQFIGEPSSKYLTNFILSDEAFQYVSARFIWLNGSEHVPLDFKKENAVLNDVFGLRVGNVNSGLQGIILRFVYGFATLRPEWCALVLGEKVGQGE